MSRFQEILSNLTFCLATKDAALSYTVLMFVTGTMCQSAARLALSTDSEIFVPPPLASYLVRLTVDLHNLCSVCSYYKRDVLRYLLLKFVIYCFVK